MQAKDRNGNVVDFTVYAGAMPPQNGEVEEAILGGILLDPNAIARISDQLRPEAFYINAHKEIYKAALALHAQGKPTDLMCVYAWLNDHDMLERVGGQNKLVQLVGNTVSSVNIDKYAQIVIDKHRRRELIRVGNDISQLGYENHLELPSVCDEAQRKLMEATNYQEGDKWASTPISDAILSAIREIESGEQSGRSTGLADLDALTGGLHRKDLIVLAGRAGMGKTWAGCYLARQFAACHRLPVVFFSAEMDKEKLTKRFLAMESGIDLAKLVQNRIEDADWDKLATAVGAIADIPLFINDTPASQLTPNKIRAELRRVQIETGQPIGLVVLDYIQKLGDRKVANRAQVVGAFAGEAKDIAKEFDCPFLALAQINREVEGQTNKRPSVAQLKDSGDIEQDADAVLLLYREEYYNNNTPDRNVLEISAGKNRNGPTGTCRVLFRPNTGFYGNLQP